jgi:hypothetical protein
MSQDQVALVVHIRGFFGVTGSDQGGVSSGVSSMLLQHLPGSVARPMHGSVAHWSSWRDGLLIHRQHFRNDTAAITDDLRPLAVDHFVIVIIIHGRISPVKFR